MILMNDFKAEPKELRLKMLAAINRVVESGWYILGHELENFQRLWAEQCGVKYAIGVGNGMDAIELALRSMNVGPGDEVVTTPMTAFATVLAILRAGARPVLADIDPETALISIKSVERCITKRTKAVILVHLYGQVRQMQMWQEFCSSKSIFLIEDCAQAHLAIWKGKCAGSFGEAGAYSFYPTKNLGALGDAGALITNSCSISSRVKCLRNYGQDIRYHHPEIGMNSRLDEMQAAILSERLKWIDVFTLKRREIAQIYRARINNPAVKLLAAPEEYSAHSYHLFVVLCRTRDGLISHLSNNGIESLIHYPIPVHMQSSCTDIQIDPNGLPNAEFHAKNCLSIPCHPQMSENDIACVINALNSYRDN